MIDAFVMEQKDRLLIIYIYIIIYMSLYIKSSTKINKTKTLPYRLFRQ